MPLPYVLQLGQTVKSKGELNSGDVIHMNSFPKDKYSRCAGRDEIYMSFFHIKNDIRFLGESVTI